MTYRSKYRAGIYSKYSPEEIFRYYLGDVELDQPIISPIREETNPSFVIRKSSSGNLYWRDYGVNWDDHKHDAIGLVCALYSTSCKNACRIIDKDLSSGSGKAKFKKKFKRKIKVNIFSHYKKPIVTEEEHRYWDRRCISRSTLRRCNVHYLLDLYKLDKLHRKSTKRRPKYIYLDKGNMDYFKIYDPLNINKKYKFYANENRDIVECWDSLPLWGDDLIISSSTKDSMTLIECGYNSIAPTSETATIALKSRIRELKARFKNIYVLFDNDATGLRASKNLKNIFNISILRWTLSKDPSDFVYKHGNLFYLKDWLQKNV